MKVFKVFVAVSLDARESASAKSDFMREVSELQSLLQEEKFDIVNLAKGDQVVTEAGSEKTFEIDECVHAADIVVCLCSFPSLGFGEVAWSHMIEKRVLSVALIPQVGRIYRGLNLVGHESCLYRWYETLSDGVAFLAEIRQRKKQQYVPLLQVR